MTSAVLPFVIILAIPLMIGFVFRDLQAKWVGFVFAGLVAASSTGNQFVLRSLDYTGARISVPTDEWLIGMILAAGFWGAVAYGITKLGSKLRYAQDERRGLIAEDHNGASVKSDCGQDYLASQAKVMSDPAYKYIPKPKKPKARAEQGKAQKMSDAEIERQKRDPAYKYIPKPRGAQ
ncbi:hypothetical protein [Tateyamaria sp. Alg231-49]|uniref:hypothetical protein n=1 Tax=Tateyamaria sp. Alg231-49 TaxID=1922219 RepID=UPI000D54E89B|nr:hypothetical protein [Tateyamaria sp. Alg231-49]